MERRSFLKRTLALLGIASLPGGRIAAPVDAAPPLSNAKIDITELVCKEFSKSLNAYLDKHIMTATSHLEA